MHRNASLLESHSCNQCVFTHDECCHLFQGCNVYHMVTLPARSIQARSRVNRWAVSWLWIDASMSRVPLSGAPHGSGKVRLGFTYRITTLSILHSAAVGPAHSLSGTIETDCPPARPLTSSAAVRAPLPHASAALSKLHVQPLRFPATPTDSSRTVQARRDINTSPLPEAFITNTPPTPQKPPPSLAVESPLQHLPHSRPAGLSIHGIRVPRLLARAHVGESAGRPC